MESLIATMLSQSDVTVQLTVVLASYNNAYNYRSIINSSPLTNLITENQSTKTV